jgi:homoserine kinase type II
MAVYTDVSLAEAAPLVARLGLGALTALHGIRSGIENTNYFADTLQPDGSGARYVLTVFERLSFAQLPFYLELMRHLAARGLPVPGPKADAGGAILHTLQGKPAAVVDCLRGGHRLAPDAAHCTSVGTVLARLHLAAADFAPQQPNLRGLGWCVETAPLVLPFVSPAQHELLQDELTYQQQLAASKAHAALPRGAIHGDLFRDNVMFEAVIGEIGEIGDREAADSNVTEVTSGASDRLSGLFDFYFAGIDTLLFDIAVCLNDWCIDLATGRLDEGRANALVGAYAAVRPLTGGEHRLLPASMRAAALRFWLSRLWDLHLPRDASLLTAHDPAHFERVLRERIATPWHAASAGAGTP